MRPLSRLSETGSFTEPPIQDVQSLKHELSMHLAFESDAITPSGLSGHAEP